jgi:MarR family transcriptional regulator for hemolysin
MQADDERKPDAWNPAATCAFWINRVSRMLLRLHEARLRPLGLTMSQLPVLLALEGERSLSQKELALRARVEQPTMAEMLARMERDGIVQREPNPADARGSLTSLSRKTRLRLPKAKAELTQGELDATAGFSAEEKALLLSLLQRVAKNLEGIAAEASG